MISYNVPMYHDKQFIGVIGIEIDYSTMAEVVNHITLYDNATGEASVSCAGLIPPQTIAAGTAFLEVTVKTAGDLTGTATYSLPAAKTFASGNAYTCTLSINLSSIGTTTDITNWGNGGSTSLNNNGTPTLQ